MGTQYLEHFKKVNKIGPKENLKPYIIPTLRYLQKKIICCTYYYRSVYENSNKAETLSIEGFNDIRDKLMALIEIPELQDAHADYLDKVCETDILKMHENPLYTDGTIHFRFRYIALFFAQLGGYVIPSQFDIKTVEGILVPGEPIVSHIDRITTDTLYEFTLVEGPDDNESISRTLLAVMVYLVIFRIKTGWDENRNI